MDELMVVLSWRWYQTVASFPRRSAPFIHRSPWTVLPRARYAL